jgi:hypothetical protein
MMKPGAVNLNHGPGMGQAPNMQKPLAQMAGRMMKNGGAVKKKAAGGTVSASKRADGIATKGKTRGKLC